MKKLLALLAVLALPISSFAATSDFLVQDGRNLSSGAMAAPAKALYDGSVAVADAHGKYQNAVRSGAVFTCSNPSGTAVTTKVGVDAAAPALTLYNPTTSTKAMVLLEDSVTFTAAPAAAADVFLAFNAVSSTAAPITTTNATIQNANLGLTTTPAGNCFRIATLVAAPVAFRYIGGTTGAAAISGLNLVDNVDGKIIIPPGVAVSIQTTSAASLLAHFEWEEIPYPFN